MGEKLKEILKDGALAADIDLTDSQLDKFEKFYEHLIEKNKVMNLTAITDERDVVYKHFIDSIALIKKINFDGKKVIDVGTGAGFPGIPLAIVTDNAEFVLMDSLNKRIKFLNEVIEICDLKNVTTIHARAEELGRDTEYREKFDYCVSRAVANMSTLLEYCIPFVRVGGVFVSYKSGDVTEEIELSKNAQKQLFCKIKDVIGFSIPNTDISRSFVVFEKKKELNKKYKQPNNYNKLLTKNVSVGLNGRKHRRNVNVLVIGGSGAGKTFSYCKPNVMQCATSYVILDPKGEIVRDTGYLLEKERI